MGNAQSQTENEISENAKFIDGDDDEVPHDIYQNVTATQMLEPQIYNRERLEEGLMKTPGSAKQSSRQDDDNDSNSSSEIEDIEGLSTSDEEDFERLENETLQTERDSMRKYPDEENSEGLFGRGSPNSDDGGDDEYEDWPLEFMQTYDRDVFFVRRHKTPSSMFVVAKRSTPLITFCRHIFTLQVDEERIIKNLSPKSFPEDATDAEIVRSVPGILARVVSDVLHEPPQFVVPLDDGSSVRVLGTDSDPIAERAENVDLPLAAAPVQIFDPIDADYEERIDAAKRMQSSSSSHNLLQVIDNKVNRNQLKQFITTGNRLPFDKTASPGFSEASPVHEGEEWFVVNRQYYYMWKAFERTCWGNGNFLIEINTRLSTLPDNTYMLGVDIEQPNVNKYSAQQEHRVLSRILETYKKTVHLEAVITQKHAMIRNLCDAACAKLDDESMRLVSAAVGIEATSSECEALRNVADACSLLRTVETLQKEMDELRKVRPFITQETNPF